nr:hypothetical protein [Tanacetum cinerariifolium]
MGYIWMVTLGEFGVDGLANYLQEYTLFWLVLEVVVEGASKNGVVVHENFHAILDQFMENGCHTTLESCWHNFEKPGFLMANNAEEMTTRILLFSWRKAYLVTDTIKRTKSKQTEQNQAQNGKHGKVR